MAVEHGESPVTAMMSVMPAVTTKARIALGLGAVGLAVSWTGIGLVGLAAGVAAIVMGDNARRRTPPSAPAHRRVATAAIALGAVAIGGVVGIIGYTLARSIADGTFDTGMPQRVQRAAVASASASTRRMLPLVTAASSASDQPRSTNSTSRRGYPLTSSSPTGNRSQPS